jgi:hypothetical protein
LRTAFWLILLSFIVYNANLRSITSFDTNPTRYLPISIIKEFDLDLDEFPFLHKYPEWWHGDKNVLPYYLQYVRGHHMSTYPVMPAILSVPVYAVPVLLGLTDGASAAIGFSRTEIVGTLLSKISASLVVGFSVGILYLTLLRLTNKSGAFWIAALYAFATSSWSVSSQGLWQTSMSHPLLAFALYFFVKAREDTRNVIYAGIPLALAVACRMTNGIFAVAFLIYVLCHYRAWFVEFLIFPVLLGSLLFTYNLYYFGSLFGAYSSHMGQFTYPSLEAFLGLLLSPSRGLLVYSPFLIFACVGLSLSFSHGRDHLLRYTSIASILTIILYSSWSQWHGAFSYSYRFLVDLLPALCLCLATTWNWIVAQSWRKSLFAASAALSIFLQIIGSFFYPCGWYETPTRANSHPERFWDWKDPEFLRCLRAGPVDPEGLQLLRQLIHK